uniref:Uncharacterized protein n=2 Tax=Gasterosteus aculeatus TaxID=69293 RepID=G3NUW8_GASAC
MSVSMAETDGRSFENPGYAQPVAMETVATHFAPDEPNKVNISNPLYTEDEPTRSANKPVTVNEESFQNPAYGSDLEDVVITSTQAAASGTRVSEPIRGDTFASFQNPTYMEDAPDSEI